MYAIIAHSESWPNNFQFIVACASKPVTFLPCAGSAIRTYVVITRTQRGTPKRTLVIYILAPKRMVFAPGFGQTFEICVLSAERYKNKSSPSARGWRGYCALLSVYLALTLHFLLRAISGVNRASYLLPESHASSTTRSSWRGGGNDIENIFSRPNGIAYTFVNRSTKTSLSPAPSPRRNFPKRYYAASADRTRDDYSCQNGNGACRDGGVLYAIVKTSYPPDPRVRNRRWRNKFRDGGITLGESSRYHTDAVCIVRPTYHRRG